MPMHDQTFVFYRVSFLASDEAFMFVSSTSLRKRKYTIAHEKPKFHQQTLQHLMSLFVFKYKRCSSVQGQGKAYEHKALRKDL